MTRVHRVRSRSVRPRARERALPRGIGEDVAASGADCLADADLARSLADRDQHDVHDADPAHEKRYGRNARQQKRQHVAHGTHRAEELSLGRDREIVYAVGDPVPPLEQRHGITNGVDDFSISTQAQLLGTVSSVSDVLTLLLAGIASISLLVGGIGIMNIMLVSVRERTREIGIRKAIGARGRDILAQFLIEALVLSLAGGLFGIAIGLAISALIGVVAGWGFIFNPLTILAAVGFSLMVGIVFGVWPASQAARLDPVVALRYE